MYRILLIVIFISALLSVAPLQAQGEPIPLAPCLNLIGTPATMTLYPDIIQRIWTEVEDESAAPFVALNAKEYIVFAGYAPDSHRSLEWYGTDFGWQDVNMFYWWHTGLLEFHDKDGVLVARAEVYEYPPWDAYLVWITALETTTDSNGKYLGYHPPKNAPVTGCNFVIEEWEFWVAMGWEYGH